MESFDWWVIAQKTHREALSVLSGEVERRPWCAYFLDDSPYHPGNLNSKCRVGYVPFDDCVQDRFYYVDTSRDPEILAAGGITTQISWDADPAHLPDGWQGVVRKSYEDSKTATRPNTLVAILAFTPNRFRGRGLSSVVLSRMRQNAHEKGFRRMIVPALPPSQFEEDKVRLSMTEVAALTREDGQAYDYWIRVHKHLGARVIGQCETSHRFAYTLADFAEYVSSTPICASGDYVVRLDRDRSLGGNAKNMYRLVHADLERDIVTFQWGCVWVQYDIE